MLRNDLLSTRDLKKRQFKAEVPTDFRYGGFFKK